MKKPNYTDGRGRYRSAVESSKPGYLAKRFEAIRRLQRMRAKANVTPLPERKTRNG